MIKKNLLIVLAVSSFCLVSCEKMELRKDLSGNWELISASGGIFPHEFETNFTNLHLNRDREYSILSVGSLKAKGNYSILDFKENTSGNLEPFYVKFNKTESSNSVVGFPFNENLTVDISRKDTLILRDLMSDGGEWLFVIEE